MAVIHISESDAIRDFASVLSQVRAGSEVIIESDLAPVTVLIPQSHSASQSPSSPDPDHDAWFRALVQQALEDTRSDTPGEDVEAHFAQRRAASLSKTSNPR